MKDIIQHIELAKLLLSGISKNANWDRGKRIAWDRSFQKIIYSLENDGVPLVKEDLFVSIFNSFHREIHDIIPVPVRIFGIPKDRLYSVSFDRYKDMLLLNTSYSDANLELMNSDWLERINFESTNSIVNLRKEFDYFNWDYDKMMEGVSLEYLSDNGFIHLLIKSKLHFVEKNFDHWFNILEKKSFLKGASQNQILKTLGEEYLKGLEKDVIIQPFPYLLIGPIQIQVSKKTSNKYILKIIEILNTQLDLREANLILIPNEFNDQRIRVGATQLDIRNYFYQLTTVKGKKTGKPTVTKESIDQLLGASFQEFDIFHFGDKIKLDLSKGTLRFFVHTFYKDFDNDKTNNKLKMYVRFLIDNFEDFKGNDPNSLYQHMSDLPPKTYPFK